MFQISDCNYGNDSRICENFFEIHVNIERKKQMNMMQTSQNHELTPKNCFVITPKPKTYSFNK